MEFLIADRDRLAVFSGAHASPANYLELLAMSIEFMRLARRNSAEVLKAGVRLESLGYDDPIIAFGLCCHDLLGAECPDNPFKAGDLAVGKILSCNPELGTQ